MKIKETNMLAISFYQAANGNFYPEYGARMSKSLRASENWMTFMEHQCSRSNCQEVYHKLCPECGEQMVEVGQAMEDNLTYVLFKCSSNNCDGQWLQSYCSSLQRLLPTG